MKFDVGKIVPGKTFFITGTSYIGNPRSNTAMYITKKVERLLSALETVSECLIFAEDSIDVPAGIDRIRRVEDERIDHNRLRLAGFNFRTVEVKRDLRALFIGGFGSIRKL